ncbi:hypothetical protein Acsp04_26430 [Actinomadura sp. NBRC 104425]|uniref:hypothetical protein n=1 Tax=Actinomadura sp. NBRC 104425 TaxID=3032204 RepID=UPI0024A4DA86|nr:hypothetical protein [Actinomadura sp. NBRC 104425]GLZ12408.1 hypothetical protein Acsp04_26430 [Actinomadura sp. NBRC 104425]
MAAVTFRDETAAGGGLDAFSVAGLPATMTVRELIRLRVREEVARHNARPDRRFTGLVQPAETGPDETEPDETEPDGGRPRKARHVDWERQADIAERAFLSNGFFVLVGDRQVEDLDEVVDLGGDPEVVFIKLVPLVGG